MYAVTMNVAGKIVLDTDVLDLVISTPNIRKRLEYDDCYLSDCSPEEPDEDLKRDAASEIEHWINKLYCPDYDYSNHADSFETEVSGAEICLGGDDLLWDDAMGWCDPIDKRMDALKTMVDLFGDHIKEYNVTFIGKDECFRHVLKNGKVVIEDGSIQAVFPD